MKKNILLFLFVYMNVLLVAQPPVLTLVLNGSTNVSCYNLCDGTASATANGGTPSYAYSWNCVPMQTNATASGLCAGSYTCTVTDMNGSTATTSVTITQPTPVVASVGPNKTICFGNCTQLVAGGGTIYNWTPAMSIDNPNISNPIACPTVTTTYTVTVSNSFGCTGTNSVQITVVPTPIVTITGTTTICSGQSTTLSCSGGGTYAWSDGTTNPTLTVSPTTTTTYSVTVTNSGCTGSASAQVTVSCTGIEEQTNENIMVKAYPNPFDDNTTFTVQSNKGNEKKYSFELFDVLGKQVKIINEINSNQFQISRDGLQNGIYFYKIYSAENIIGIGKLVVK